MEHKPVRASGALWRGAGGALFTALLALGFSVILSIGFDVKGAWHWTNLFWRDPPSLRQLQTITELENNLNKLFELIFVIAVLVSVFAQQTISQFFSLNKLDTHSAMVLKFPIYSCQPDGKWHLHAKRIGKPISADKVLRLGWIIIVLNICASISIVAVGNFAFHVVTTMVYLAIVLFLDLITWICLCESDVSVTYRGIRPYRLLRYMSGQLLFTIDSGILVILFIVILGIAGGFAGNSMTEKAFFTGVVSFYLISTCILIRYLFYHWNAILNRRGITD